MTEGRKDDQGKLRFDLIPAGALHELVAVYSMGAKKYSDRNWELGMKYPRLFGALMRHAWAFWMGETHDKESGLHHMAHAAFSCLALVEYSAACTGEDDRPYGNSNEPKLADLLEPPPPMRDGKLYGACEKHLWHMQKDQRRVTCTVCGKVEGHQQNKELSNGW